MNINIISQPSEIEAISDNLRVNVECTDFVSNSGTQATASIAIVFPNQNNGDYIIIAGQKFTVANANSSNTVNWINPTTAEQAAQNLQAAISMNWVLSDKVLTEVQAAGFGFALNINWKDKGVQESFNFSQSLLNSVFITNTNGTDIEYKQGAKVLLKLYDAEINQLINTYPIWAKPTLGNIATFYLRELCKNTFDRYLPNFSCTSTPYLVSEHHKDFNFKCVGVENNTDCGVSYGTAKGSQEFRVYNTNFDDTDPYKLLPYYLQSVGQVGSKRVKWLTYRGDKSVISCDNCAFIHFINNLPSSHSLSVKYEAFKSGSSLGVFTHATTIQGKGTWAIPLNLNQSFIPSDSDKIDVWITEEVTQITEKMTLGIDRELEDREHLYFLNDLGVYEFLSFDSIASIDIETNGDEICSKIQNNESDNIKMMQNGKELTNLEAVKTITIQTTERQRSEWYSKLIEQLFKSPSIFLRYSSDASDNLKRKVYILPNSLQVFQKDEKVSIEFRIRTHNELKIANF